VSVDCLPTDQEARECLIDNLSANQESILSSLDSEFFSYPDDLTELLFAFVAARPQVFGDVPTAA